jgi:hypothetical protein
MVRSGQGLRNWFSAKAMPGQPTLIGFASLSQEQYQKAVADFVNYEPSVAGNPCK